MRLRDLQEERPRFAQHALLNVKVGQPLERRQLGGRQLGNFLVDRDRFAVEAVAEVDLRQPLEVFDGLRHVALAREEIAYRHQRGLVFRVVTEDLLVFADSLSDFALVEKFQCALERFALIEGHEGFCVPFSAPAPSAVWRHCGSVSKVSTREKGGSTN